MTQEEFKRYFDILKETVRNAVEFRFSDEYHPDRWSDEEVYIAEAAIELFYGKEIWKRFNEE